VEVCREEEVAFFAWKGRMETAMEPEVVDKEVSEPWM